MPTGYHDNSNNPTNNFVLHRAGSTGERGIPAVGKMVYRTDLGYAEVCTSTSPNATSNGGGTWEQVFDGGTAPGSGGYVTWTPALTATGSSPVDPSSTSPTSLGVVASAIGLYFVQIRYAFGSSTSAGNDIYQFSLPGSLSLVTAAPWSFGAGFVQDQSTGARKVVAVVGGYADGSHVSMMCEGGYVAAGHPWAWADSDQINISFMVVT